MIWIDTIFKHVKTWNQNMMKYSNIWANGTKKVGNKVIPWIAASKSSDQKPKTNQKLSWFKLVNKIQKQNLEFIFGYDEQ